MIVVYFHRLVIIRPIVEKKEHRVVALVVVSNRHRLDWLLPLLSVCLSLSLCLSVCLSVSLSLPPSLFLSLSIPHPPQVVCDEPSVMVMERVRWLERNILVAASRVLKHMLAERERVRAERMLEVCGALIDLDTSILSLKIIKHVSN